MFPISEQFLVKPSLLLKYVEEDQLYFDMNFSMLISKVLWLGVSYRSHTKTVVLLTELIINKKFKIGYSFDTYLGDIKAYNIGSHEFMLSYRVNVYKVWQKHPVYF